MRSHKHSYRLAYSSYCSNLIVIYSYSITFNDDDPGDFKNLLRKTELPVLHRHLNFLKAFFKQLQIKT